MSRTRRKSPAAPPQHGEAVRQTGELAALRRMLVASQGCFSLSFAVCNDRTLRNELVQALTSEFPDIEVISISPGTSDVYQVVSERLGARIPPAVFLLDLESCIPFEAKAYPVLRALNSSRELWERFACPVVFWLAEYAAALVTTAAPDFWRYRSHQFEFVSEQSSLGRLTAEPFPGYPMVDGLSAEAKRFRLAELEQRLEEVGTSPSPELLPHALGWAYELAYLYRHTNQFDRALDLSQRALDWAESAYGPHDPRTSVALVNPAALLKATNRLTEAEPLLRRALAIDQQVYGADHPEVASDLNNLAQLLQDTNRLAEAEPLMRAALAIDEHSLGADHPAVARDLNNLARLLQDTNRMAEAEPLMRRALAIAEQSYGVDHPSVAICLNNLAQLLQATNRLAKAEPLMRRALAIVQQSYGADHPNVAICLNNLARLLQATNRLAEAEPVMRRATQILLASYGQDHPRTRTALQNYARLLTDMGQSDAEVRAALDKLTNAAS